jgi:tetratricopeptide (TPR) repeat protein
MTDPTQEQIKSLEERLAREPQSPLFARLAAYYLSTGRPKDALRLCDNGLAHYPFYSTAHLIKGNVLVSLGMMAEAKHEYEVVREFMPSSETASRLWSSIDLGTPSDFISTPAAEEIAEATETVAEPEPIPIIEPEPVEEAVAAPAPTPEPVVEEVVQQEAAPPEEMTAVAEEVPPQEPVAEEPPPVEPAEATTVAEDAFGMPVEPAPAEEEPFGAAQKLGLPFTEEPISSAETGFGAPAEATPQAVEETPFGELPVQEPETATDPFGQVLEPPAETTAPETTEPAVEIPAEAATSEQPEWLDAFSQLQQPTEESPAAAAQAPVEEENPFAAFGSDQPTSAAEAESYEDYTARVRMELFGTENTMSLEEYLQGTPSSGPGEPDQIGELAEKLKTSPRITPPVINFAEKSNRTAGDVDAASESGFVTPTLAEIYVKQGWYDDAIKAYKTLAANKPEEREKYELRVAEIEEMRKSSK